MRCLSRLILAPVPRTSFLAILAILACATAVSPLTAQKVTAVIPGGSLEAQSVQPKAATPAHITLTTRQMPLERVITEVARQAGMGVLRRADGLPLNTRVTVALRDATVAQAIAAVTRGTGISAEIASDGETITLARAVRSRGVKAQGVISGVVSDAKTSKPISGASVSLSMADRGVTTGEDGTYRLVGVTNGAHTVTVRLLGYAKQTRQVTVAEGTTVIQDFKLEPSASVLDQVVVTGSVAQVERRAVPNAMTVVTAKDIEQRGITKIDQLFRGEVPGLYAYPSPGGIPQGGTSQGAAGFGGTVMFSRGISKGGANPGTNIGLSSAMKTYVDGVELTNPEFLNAIDPRSIERIEILSGPQASTVYGSGAMTGVMQVFTKKGSSTSKRELTLSLQSGVVQNALSSSLAPQHDHSAQLTGGDQATSYNVGGGYTYIGEWMPYYSNRSYSGYGSIRRKEGKVTAEASARFLQRVIGAGIASGSRGEYENSFNGFWIPISAVQGSVHRKLTLNTHTLGAVFSADIHPWWQQRLTLGSDEVKMQLIATEPSRSRPADSLFFYVQTPSRKQTVSYSTTFSSALGRTLSGTLTAGADYIVNETGNISTSVVSAIGSLTTPNGVSLSRGEQRNKGYYTQGQLALSDALFLTAGVRADDNVDYGEDFGINISPRVGASYVRDLGPATFKLRTAFGVATRAPASGARDGRFVTLATQIGQFGLAMDQFPNPNLGPERQRGGEVGVELYFGNRASVQVTNYHQLVDHMIFSVLVDSAQSIQQNPSGCRVQADGYCYLQQRQNQNVGRVKNSGWEGQGEVKFLRDLTFSGTWSYTQSRVTGLQPGYVCTSLVSGNFGNCFFQGQALYNFPEHTAAARLTYSHARATVDLSVSRIGQRLIVNSNREAGITFLVRLPTALSSVQDNAIPFSVPGFQTVDLQSTYSLGRRTNVLVRITNLTNKNNSDSSDEQGTRYFTMGRQILTGMVWRF